MADQQINKHHYIPQTYLKRWCGADRMLCEYQNFRNGIVVRRVHPAQTGWTDRLYSVPTLAPELVDLLERVFFARVDQEAADAMDELNRSGQLLTPKLRSAWSRFMMSLMQRHPGKIKEHWRNAEREFQRTKEDHRALYLSQRRPEDPESYDEFCRIHDPKMIGVLFARVIQAACDMKNVGEHLNRMVQGVFRLDAPRLTFLTSDNPLIINVGLSHPACRILLPIGPRRLFIATNSEGLIRATDRELREGDLVERINAQVVSQAYRFAYAICENRREWVERYWPREQPRTYAHLKPPEEAY